MFHIHVMLTVNDESDVAKVGELLSQAAALSREEKGCERFEVYHSQSDTNVYILLEWWESEQAWKDHRDERAFQEIYQPQVLPLVNRVPHIAEKVA